MAGKVGPWSHGHNVSPKTPNTMTMGRLGGDPRPTDHADRPCPPTVPTGLSDHRRRGTMNPLAYCLPDHGLIMVRLTDNRPRRGLPGRPGPWVNWMRWPTSSMGTQPARPCARVPPNHGHTTGPTDHGQCGGPEVASPSCVMEYMFSYIIAHSS